MNNNAEAGPLGEVVAAWVRSRRALMGLTQAEFAPLIGLQRETLARLESGHRKRMRMEQLETICIAFDVSLVDILGWSPRGRETLRIFGLLD